MIKPTGKAGLKCEEWAQILRILYVLRDELAVAGIPSKIAGDLLELAIFIARTNSKASTESDLEHVFED